MREDGRAGERKGVGVIEEGRGPILPIIIDATCHLNRLERRHAQQRQSEFPSRFLTLLRLRCRRVSFHTARRVKICTVDARTSLKSENTREFTAQSLVEYEPEIQVVSSSYRSGKNPISAAWRPQDTENAPKAIHTQASDFCGDGGRRR